MDQPRDFFETFTTASVTLHFNGIFDPQNHAVLASVLDLKFSAGATSCTVEGDPVKVIAFILDSGYCTCYDDFAPRIFADILSTVDFK